MMIDVSNKRMVAFIILLVSLLLSACGDTKQNESISNSDSSIVISDSSEDNIHYWDKVSAYPMPNFIVNDSEIILNKTTYAEMQSMLDNCEVMPAEVYVRNDGSTHVTEKYGIEWEDNRSYAIITVNFVKYAERREDKLFYKAQFFTYDIPDTLIEQLGNVSTSINYHMKEFDFDPSNWVLSYFAANTYSPCELTNGIEMKMDYSAVEDFYSEIDKIGDYGGAVEYMGPEESATVGMFGGYHYRYLQEGEEDHWYIVNYTIYANEIEHIDIRNPLNVTYVIN